ncbi:MAG: radical SAM protein [Treponema sp.]|jgi:histidinol dehydrogenase|nr:radical SAM protein [Treponema sp.]
MIIAPSADHRSREGGTIVYPVYSRRSRGLSVGINLFPGGKCCSFNCPYCEVFPCETNIVFSLETMKSALRSCLLEAAERGVEVKDICFSGNGEPVMAAAFPEALQAAEVLRRESAPGAKLVVITNGSGLLNPEIFILLRRAALESGLHIWLKVDAGTESWYGVINRSALPFRPLFEAVQAFAASGAPFTPQTMICGVNGLLPPPEEEAAWVELITELAVPGTLRAVQIYGKARPAPEDPLAVPAPAEVLERRAVLLRAALSKATPGTVPVEVHF